MLMLCFSVVLRKMLLIAVVEDEEEVGCEVRLGLISLN